MAQYRTKARINISVSAELHDALKELAVVSDKTVSKFPAHILENALPTIKQLTKAYKVARTNKDKAQQIINDELERTLAQGASEVFRDP